MKERQPFPKMDTFMPIELRQLRDSGDDLFMEYKMSAESYLEIIEL